ncbi:MAG: FAD-dependent oxidoreductase [Desulfobacteraceae bacterium]
MPKRKHLMIGCGSAALSALKQIRKLGSEDEVKLVTMENYAPYSPMSLPYLLSGKKKESEIYLAESNFFDNMKATFITGRRVDGIIPRDKSVVYDNGESESYDTLLIATGSQPVRPRIKGLEGANFLGFHTLDDYHEMLGQLRKGSELAVLGAGLVGMEVAAALSERGYKVTVLEKEKGVLPLSFDQPVGAYISQIYAEHDVDIFTDKEVTEIRTASKKREIVCADSDVFQADLVVCCVGVASRVSMLEGSGIEANRGILVDNRMSSSIDGIYAAGDVAEAPDFFTGKNGLSPILPSAVEQGKIAGSNMIGEKAFYDGWLSMNLYNFFGHLAVSIGEFTSSNGDEVLTERDDDKREYGKIICREDRLVGANFFNIDLDGGVLQYLIRNRIDIGPSKSQLLQQPREVSLWLMHKAEKRGTLSLEH